MPAIASAKAPAIPQPNPNRAAWREQMLGQFLEQMREHTLPEDVVSPRGSEAKAPFKGQYIDVYV